MCFRKVTAEQWRRSQFQVLWLSETSFKCITNPAPSCLLFILLKPPLCPIDVAWRLLSLFVLCWQHLCAFSPPFSPSVVNTQVPVLTRLLKTSTSALLTSCFSHAAGRGRGMPEPPGENTENWGFRSQTLLKTVCFQFFMNVGFFQYSPCPSEAKEGPRSAGAVSVGDWVLPRPGGSVPCQWTGFW